MRRCTTLLSNRLFWKDHDDHTLRIFYDITYSNEDFPHFLLILVIRIDGFVFDTIDLMVGNRVD